MNTQEPRSTLFPYTTLFRSSSPERRFCYLTFLNLSFRQVGRQVPPRQGKNTRLISESCQRTHFRSIRVRPLLHIKIVALETCKDAYGLGLHLRRDSNSLRPLWWSTCGN